MSREQKEQHVKGMIQSLYRLAAVTPVWDGDVNDNVAVVVEKMLSETKACSRAFVWVPRPPAGRATVNWLCMQIGQSMFASSRARLSQACARTVILRWRSTLEMAALGLAVTKSRMPA